MPGLVYTLSDSGKGMMGPWIVERDGTLVQLANKPDPALSPDRGQLAYSRDGDIWVLDILTGVEKNLTNSYDVIEDRCQWWPARPGLIVFHYRIRGDDRYAAGYLARIQSDGTNYYIIDGQVGGHSRAALSPDGRSIVYDRDGKPWIFRFGEGRSEIPSASFPEHFGLAADPTWSPDSGRVAWLLYGLSEGSGDSTATAVLDLGGITAALLHRFPAADGNDAGSGHLAWSPDGAWLATANPSEKTDDGETTLWVMRPDGSEEIRLGAGDYPVWSPDGAMLVYQNREGVSAVKPGNWIPFTITLPASARVVDWITF